MMSCRDNPMETSIISYNTYPAIMNQSFHENNIPTKYLNLSINKKSDYYTTEYVDPETAPYYMSIEVIAQTNSQPKESLYWYTDKEYYTNECGDYEECPLIFDLMSDSTTVVNGYGISNNNILVTLEFVNEPINIYSYLIDKNGIYYRDTLQVLITW